MYRQESVFDARGRVAGPPCPPKGTCMPLPSFFRAKLDKPVCRLCGAKHFSYEPHVFKDSVEVERGVLAKPVANPNVPVKRNQAVTTCNQCVTKDAEIARLRNQLEKKPAKRDRAEYMRGYRKREQH